MGILEKMRLDGKKAFVTGGARGIGKCIAIALAEAGADVAKMCIRDSSYTAYQEGIEIEIDTREEYRRMGLAYACGARLILECLARGIYPSWDAHNLESAALAEKLGYHYDRPYTAFLIHSSTSMRK